MAKITMTEAINNLLVVDVIRSPQSYGWIIHPTANKLIVLIGKRKGE
jgi:hypothetical protein